MKKILVIFGSKSDFAIYEQIIKQLDELKLSYEFRICSAHRTPELLEQIMKKDYSLIISGAGLAAHLPGVIASKTIRPVIGVPVSSNYQGLDALLSIMQMPPGIPVMSVGVGQALEAANNAAKFFKHYKEVNIIGEKENKRVQKCIEVLKKFKIKNKLSFEIDSKALNIKFITLDEMPAQKEELIIYCPMCEEHDVEAALNVLHNSGHGLWVGLNRGENAALCAIEIMNRANKYSKQLINFRKKMKKEVKQHDKKHRKTGGKKK